MKTFFVLSFLLSLFESFNSHVWGFVVWEQQDQQSSLGSVFIDSEKNDKLASDMTNSKLLCEIIEHNGHILY